MPENTPTSITFYEDGKEVTIDPASLPKISLEEACKIDFRTTHPTQMKPSSFEERMAARNLIDAEIKKDPSLSVCPKAKIEYITPKHPIVTHFDKRDYATKPGDDVHHVNPFIPVDKALLKEIHDGQSMDKPVIQNCVVFTYKYETLGFYIVAGYSLISFILLIALGKLFFQACRSTLGRIPNVVIPEKLLLAGFYLTGLASIGITLPKIISGVSSLYSNTQIVEFMIQKIGALSAIFGGTCAFFLVVLCITYFILSAYHKNKTLPDTALPRIPVKLYYSVSTVVWFLSFIGIMPVLLFTVFSPYGGPYLVLYTVPVFIISFITKIIIDTKYDNLSTRIVTSLATWLAVYLTFAIPLLALYAEIKK